MSFSPLRQMTWCSTWHQWLARDVGLRKLFGPITIFVSISVPCALVGYVFAYLWLESSFLTFLGGIVLLMWCFGPGDTGRDIELYSQSYRDPTDDSAIPPSGNFLSEILASGVGDDAVYQRAVATVSNERIFAPVLWFAVLGPLGALLFRMASVLNRSGELTGPELFFTQRLHDVLLWVPARLIALGLGLAGTLGPVLTIITQHTHGLDGAEKLVGDAALAAHDSSDRDGDAGDVHIESITSMLSLVKRAFVVWLAVLAVAAAAGIV
ncbi:MAG: hypothetical protein VCB59_12395 [Gammaproteobacteria bacterium]